MFLKLCDSSVLKTHYCVKFLNVIYSFMDFNNLLGCLSQFDDYCIALVVTIFRCTFFYSLSAFFKFYFCPNVCFIVRHKFKWAQVVQSLLC